MLIFRWIIIILVALNYLFALVKYIKKDEKLSDLIATFLVGIMDGYVVYWLIHTVNML